eukprot:COSAG04_NODE_4171_length_2257_cov_2.344300_1_plen_617_part_10
MAALLLLLAAAAAGGHRQHPVARHVGVWDSPPAVPELVPQDTTWTNGSATHDPSYLMQPQPLAGNGDIGLCFDGPPEETTLHLTTTSFWSSNVAPDSSRPIPHYRYEYFTHTRIGTLTLTAPSLAGASYRASQELQAARINASFGSSAAPLLRHSSIVTATDSVVLTRLEVSRPTPIALTLRHPTGWVYGANLPAAAGVDSSGANPTLWMWRKSVTRVDNSLVGASCYVGGQRPVSQLFAVGKVTGAVKMRDGRCLRLLRGADGAASNATIGACGGAETEWVLRRARGPAPAPSPSPSPSPPSPSPPSLRNFTAVAHRIGAQPPYAQHHCKAPTGAPCQAEVGAACLADAKCAGFAICPSWRNGSVAELFTHAQVEASIANDLWTLWKKDMEGSRLGAERGLNESYELAHPESGLCVSVAAHLNTLPLSPCGESTTRWRHNASSGHIFKADTIDTFDVAWQGGGKCVTAVEPNPIVLAGIGVVLRAADGAKVDGVVSSVNASDGSATLSVTLPRGEYDIATDIETRGDCRGCSADTNTSHVQAEALARAKAARPSALRDAHAEWWRRYWHQVIPTPLHVLGRISPISPPFFPVFCAFSPSRRGGSNEPQTGIQGPET